MPIPQGLDPIARGHEVRRRLSAALRERAGKYRPGKLAEICRRLRLALPGLVLRDQRRRWESCDGKGGLRINWRIIQAPPTLVEYVLAHELAHLQHRHHDPTFWALLGRPDYEARRARLRELGPDLVW